MYFPWDAGLENTKALRVLTFFFGEVPPKPGKPYLRNHFWPLKSGFLAIAGYKMRFFQNPVMCMGCPSVLNNFYPIAWAGPVRWDSL